MVRKSKFTACIKVLEVKGIVIKGKRNEKEHESLAQTSAVVGFGRKRSYSESAASLPIRRTSEGGSAKWSHAKNSIGHSRDLKITTKMDTSSYPKRKCFELSTKVLIGNQELVLGVSSLVLCEELVDSLHEIPIYYTGSNKANETSIGAKRMRSNLTKQISKNLSNEYLDLPNEYFQMDGRGIRYGLEENARLRVKVTFLPSEHFTNGKYEAAAKDTAEKISQRYNNLCDGKPSNRSESLKANRSGSLKNITTFQTKSTQSTRSFSRVSSSSENEIKRFNRSLADDISQTSSSFTRKERELSPITHDSSKINLVHLTDVEYINRNGPNSKGITRQKYEKFLNVDNPDRYFVGGINKSNKSLKCIDEETNLQNYNFGMEENETDVIMHNRSRSSLRTRNSDIFDGVSML